MFSPRASADHYRGLAKQMLLSKLSGERVRAKDYLYALRAILAARWVLGGKKIPPVPFAELVPYAPELVTRLVPELLAHKARTVEAEQMARIPTLDSYLAESLGDIESAIAGMTHTPATGESG